MTIFNKGDCCMLKRKCETCKKIKHGENFYFNMSNCKDCYLHKINFTKANEEKINKKLKKMFKWRNVDLGIEGLNKEEPITFFTTDINSGSIIPYEKALKMYEEGLLSVYKPNEVYQLFGESKFLKQSVCLKAEYTCHYCGSFGNTVDHIEPVAKGGLWIEPNLVCACEKCNKEKSDMDYDTFIKNNGVKKEKKKGSKLIGYNKHGIPIRNIK